MSTASITNNGTSIDGLDWAQAFVAQFPAFDPYLGDLCGWFQDAIEAGLAAGRQHIHGDVDLVAQNPTRRMTVPSTTDPTGFCGATIIGYIIELPGRES